MHTVPYLPFCRAHRVLTSTRVSEKRGRPKAIGLRYCACLSAACICVTIACAQLAFCAAEPLVVPLTANPVGNRMPSTTQASATQNTMTTPNPAIERIQRLWEQEIAALSPELSAPKNAKKRISAEIGALYGIVARADPETFRGLVAAMSAAPEVAEGFDAALLNTLIVVMAERRERSRIVDLIAQKCPERISPDNPIEFFFASQAANLPDGVLILCDAYEKSKTKSAQANLIRALEHGFSVLAKQYAPGASDTADAAFVVQVRSWYLKNRNDIELNVRYGIELATPRKDLFILKSEPK
jgi:hypothetical protein